MDLKCKRLDCEHNNKYSCTAKGILVKNTLTCSTYTPSQNPQPEQKQDVSKTMWSVVPNIHPFRHCNKIDINCKAKCLFNKEGHCAANGITIDDEDNRPTCYTHIPQ